MASNDLFSNFDKYAVIMSLLSSICLLVLKPCGLAMPSKVIGFNYSHENEKKMWQQFFFFCPPEGQIQRHYDGKNFRQKFVISGSLSTMQQCIINNIRKNKH